jgi:hypothetical protein
MKPPPRPRRDLPLSTAVWLLATAAAVGLVGATLVTPRDFTTAAVVLGLAQVAAGYVWIVWLTARRDWVRGVLAAVPPLTFAYLGQRKYARFRPLRFVVTGAAVAALAAAAGAVQPHARTLAGVEPPAPPPAPPPDITTRPKLDQLRHYRDNRQYTALVKLLAELAATDTAISAEAAQKADLRAETRALCDHPDIEVRTEALAAFATWGGADEARDRCLAAVRSENPELRLMGLKLLPRWPGDRVAAAVVSRLQQRPGRESAAAAKALTELARPFAERAVVPLLGDQHDQHVRLAAIEVLTDERVASPTVVVALRDAARASLDPGVKLAASAAADRIEVRLKK